MHALCVKITSPYRDRWTVDWTLKDVCGYPLSTLTECNTYGGYYYQDGRIMKEFYLDDGDDCCWRLLRVVRHLFILFRSSDFEFQCNDLLHLRDRNLQSWRIVIFNALASMTVVREECGFARISADDDERGPDEPCNLHKRRASSKGEPTPTHFAAGTTPAEFIIRPWRHTARWRSASPSRVPIVGL